MFGRPCWKKNTTKVLDYSVANANVDFDKNMLLLKNPQISPNHYETLTQ